MLYSPVFMPLFHGASGILDELLLFCMPLVVVVIILAIASQRARQKAQPRERSARDITTKPPNPPEA